VSQFSPLRIYRVTYIITRSALIMLHEAHASSPKHTKISSYFRDNHKVDSCNLDISRSVAAVPETREHKAVGTCVKEASPFLVALLYQIAVVNERTYREKGTSESLEALDLIKMVLGKFSTRWKSAGESCCHVVEFLRQERLTSA
jgi:hypothetical protein